MEIGVEDIRKKLDDYFLNGLSRDELGKWAKLAYYDLLKGEFLEINKLMTYPFLKVISTFHIEEDDMRDIFPSSLEEIEYIRNVLSGKYNDVFSIETRIPWNTYHESYKLNRSKKVQYCKLIKILYSYLNTQIFTQEDFSECVNSLKLPEDRPGTIQSFLDNYIKSFLKNNLDYEESSLNIRLRTGLYVHKRKTEKDILLKMIKYLECYIGERNLEVDLVIISGNPHISFSIL